MSVCGYIAFKELMGNPFTGMCSVSITNDQTKWVHACMFQRMKGVGIPIDSQSYPLSLGMAMAVAQA